MDSYAARTLSLSAVVVAFRVTVMQNRVFFPQSAVDQWGIAGEIDFIGSELILLAEGRRYKVEEAVHIVRDVTDAPDDRKIIGKVKSRQALIESGAELLEGSMILGENAYDVVPGWLGSPTCPFAEHLASPERMSARGDRTDVGGGPKNDEQILRLLVEIMQ